MLTASTFYVDMVNMDLIKRLWRQSPSLTATAIIMLGAFFACVAGMGLDHRTITGVSAWLKPAKFAISTAIFATTAAWIYGYLDVSKRLRWTARILAATLILEVVIIDVQAFRGTTSHFNVATSLDGTLFAIMGVTIAVLWLATIVLCAALFRQRFSNEGLGWALRLGMLLTVIGSAAGGLMLRTTPEQTAQHRMHQNVNANGAHTVGAPDGGPGLPGVGWSIDHGDLRVPHFMGLHALQAIPFFAWIIGARRRAIPLIFTAAASYFGLFAILAWQALRGESIVQPSPLTLTVLGIWLFATVAAGGLSQFTFATRNSAAAGLLGDS